MLGVPCWGSDVRGALLGFLAGGWCSVFHVGVLGMGSLDLGGVCDVEVGRRGREGCVAWRLLLCVVAAVPCGWVCPLKWVVEINHFSYCNIDSRYEINRLLFIN